MKEVVLICLANSRKHSGRCFAGREILAFDGSKVGGWIRPISRHPNAGLTAWDQRLEDGTIPDLLDVVCIGLQDSVRHPQHAEDYRVAPSPWRRLGRFPYARLESLVQAPNDLWLAQEVGRGGLRHDRFPETEAASESLFLIRPQRLALAVRDKYGESGKQQVRAHFVYNGTSYDLVVTDLGVEDEVKSGSTSNPIVLRDAIVCVSLSEPFNGHVYKLVAAVFVEDRFK